MFNVTYVWWFYLVFLYVLYVPFYITGTPLIWIIGGHFLSARSQLCQGDGVSQTVTIKECKDLLGFIQSHYPTISTNVIRYSTPSYPRGCFIQVDPIYLRPWPNSTFFNSHETGASSLHETHYHTMSVCKAPIGKNQKMLNDAMIYKIDTYELFTVCIFLFCYI